MNNISYSRSVRTTLNQSAMYINSNLSAIQSQLVELQKKMATGKSINTPSDDPFGTVLVMQLQNVLENKAQYQENVELAGDMLAATDAALGDIGEVISEARSTGLGEIGATATAETREAAAIVIDAMIDEVLSKANSTFNDRYLFAGTATGEAPFEAVGTDIVFRGNNESLYTRTDQGAGVDFNITPDAVFGTESSLVVGFNDLDPTLNAGTTLSVLNNGGGVGAGSIVISDGTNETTVDLSHAKSVGDVIDAINDAVPGTTSCSLNAGGGGLVITSTLPGADMTISEASNGTTAEDLGIACVSAGATVTGSDLDARLSLQTDLTLLSMGAGIDLASGMVVENGDYSATLTFSGCTTVEDVLNEINGAGLHVRARLADDGKTLEMVSELHGPSLRVSEAGGATASGLGLRSLNATTRLSALNDELGVRDAAGDDFTITCRSGDTIDIDVSDLMTVGDVIDAINNDADNAGKVLAQFATSGNGIELVDLTVDAGVTFGVTELGESRAATDLGIAASAAPGGDTITGEDVNAVRNHSVFTHLMDLRDALLAGDDAAINQALERLDTDFSSVLNGRGEAGTKTQRMEVLSMRIDQEILDAQDFMSRTQDLDYATTVVEYTTLETALQACLQTAATIVSMSLLDFMD